MAGNVATISFEEMADPHVGRITWAGPPADELSVSGRRCMFYQRKEYIGREPAGPAWWVALHIVNALISSEESSVSRRRLPGIQPVRMITVRDRVVNRERSAYWPYANRKIWERVNGK